MVKILQIFLMLSVLVQVSSCIENHSLSTNRKSSSPISKSDVTDSSGESSARNAVPADSDDSEATITDIILEHGKAELMHLVDPVDGTFHKKVTVPKNYAGYFYLSGLNIASLRSRIVNVRFNFGREFESVTIPATVGRAPGLTPQTDIEVLILDMADRPFSQVRLLYDLYDYNDYRDENGDEADMPTQDPYDSKLYCRGLKLEFDSTFDGSASNTKCDEKGERCLYSYAKILDSGLYKNSDPEDSSSDLVAITPTLPQVDISGGGLFNESITNRESRCLPDSFNAGELEAVTGTDITTVKLGMSLDLEDSSGNSTSYIFNGPFRPMVEDEWEIKTDSGGSSSAIFFPLPDLNSDLYDSYPAGIFQSNGDSLNEFDLDTGYDSFLFPRRGYMDLSSNVEHLSSEDEWGTVSQDTLLVSGETNSMYGCNIRASNYDEYSNEGIASCNVSATIEVLILEDSEYIVIEDSIDLKLQLVRESIKDYRGEEVLYTSMKSCSSSNSCASDECCFNNRCWHNSLVSQCPEDLDVVGNLQVGEDCNSDYECTSLCCGSSTHVCEVHLLTSDQEVLCSKSPFQQCVSTQFCQKENIVHCFIVNTGVSPLNEQECALRCYNIPTHGECQDGLCHSPVPPSIPEFDPENPDCTYAMDPPTADAVELSILNSSTDDSGDDSGDGTESVSD